MQAPRLRQFSRNPDDRTGPAARNATVRLPIFLAQGSKDISFFDLHRWLVGESPWWFLAEVTIRAIIVYAVLLITLRAMGRRVASQMTISELAIVVTLGAA